MTTTRREFLVGAAGGLLAAGHPSSAGAQSPAASGLDFPIEDLPTMAFLKMAKAEGIKFSFGASSMGATINPVDWSIATARELGLTRKDMFQPAPRGRKPIQVRKLRT
jgi:hypothetical protein